MRAILVSLLVLLAFSVTVYAQDDYPIPVKGGGGGLSPNRPHAVNGSGTTSSGWGPFRLGRFRDCSHCGMKDWLATPTYNSVSLHWHSINPDSAKVRLKIKGGSWNYYWVDEATTASHTIVFESLLADTVYYWGTGSRTPYCDSLSWSADKSFVTPCPTITPSAFASQAITANSAVLHLHLDIAAHVGFRYHTSPSGAWIYRHTLDDSIQATISIVDLPASTLITWESMNQYGTCDSCAYGDSASFTTATDCPTVVVSGAAAQAITTTGVTLHFHTDYAVHGTWRLSLDSLSSYYYWHDADGDSVQHTKVTTGSIFEGYLKYKWDYTTKYTGCDSTSWTTGAHFHSACGTPIATPTWTSPDSTIMACSSGGVNLFQATATTYLAKLVVEYRRHVDTDWITVYGSNYDCSPASVGALAATTQYDVRMHWVNGCGASGSTTTTYHRTTDGSGLFAACGEE